MMNAGAREDVIFDRKRWDAKLAELKDQYRNNAPYPHVVLEDFLDKDLLESAITDLEEVEKSDAWISYVHFNENKKGFNKIDSLPSRLRGVIKQLNSPDFLRFLEGLSGIDNLMADDSFEGGGVHQSTRGGFLNIHADFTVHPRRRNWQRRVNVIVYLNKDWKDEWGGHLEMWDKEMTGCEVRVTPVFNRCVIFNTDAYSFHGHPVPMTCPSGSYRRSIALYFYTQERHPFRRATNYKARPGDGARKILIGIDNLMLSVYTRMKGLFGNDDEVVGRFLRIFQRRKG